VGFDPQRFSAPLAQFHQQNMSRAAQFPQNLLTTATHDHKRGEDTRARLAVISERSVWFAEKIQQWQALANSLSLRAPLGDGIAPSPADELILYQTLLGTWPLELDLDDDVAVKQYLDRLIRWQEKAVREAKLRSSWSSPNTAYETASRNFLTTLLTADETQILRKDIATAAASIAPAGALNSLSQTLLRMSAPGVPDLYQGAEFWDFSLVDPDNRQPVDFESRINALVDIAAPDVLIKEWKNGHIKQWLILQTLTLRNANLSLFTYGNYQPLEVEGEHAERVVAFIRYFQHTDGHKDYLLVVVPRLTATLLADSMVPHIPPANWLETRILLPQELAEGCFVSGFSLTSTRPSQRYLLISEILVDIPVNILYFKPDQENLS
jgi:(1->4)-alpha-D-glucan 1-alpha-D-glucosylmutase